MTPETKSLRTVREETIDALCRRFAADDLSLGELERRLEKARAARSRDELQVLLADLATASPFEKSGALDSGPRPRRQPTKRQEDIPEAATAARPGTKPATRTGDGGRDVGAARRPSSHLAFAVMGGTRRAGRWVPPSSMVAVAIMGGVELDFRDAVFENREIDVNCFAFWGAVVIVVPPDIHVDTHGFPVMGGFEQKDGPETRAEPGAPVIRVNGVAVMAGVEVRVVERGAAGAFD